MTKSQRATKRMAPKPHRQTQKLTLREMLGSADLHNNEATAATTGAAFPLNLGETSKLPSLLPRQTKTIRSSLLGDHVQRLLPHFFPTTPTNASASFRQGCLCCSFWWYTDRPQPRSEPKFLHHCQHHYQRYQYNHCSSHYHQRSSWQQ